MPSSWGKNLSVLEKGERRGNLLSHEKAKLIELWDKFSILETAFSTGLVVD